MIIYTVYIYIKQGQTETTSTDLSQFNVLFFNQDRLLLSSQVKIITLLDLTQNCVR